VKIIIGSARSDENGKATGGKPGDQKQKSIPDYKGEVSLQEFYVSSKGWYVLRPKKEADALAMAKKMETACNNPNIGYDQSNRLGVLKYSVDTKTPTECDCSALVRACIKEATGKDPGNFSTADEVKVLEASGLFEKEFEYKNDTKLCTGDVLVTKVKGHTVIVVEGNSRSSSAPTIQVAKSKDNSLSGTYRVTASALNIRSGAGTTFPSLGEIKKNKTVKCYGYYNTVNGTKWYLVVYGEITGYCSSKYLVKV